jgi:hypothetical protein
LFILGLAIILNMEDDLEGTDPNTIGNGEDWKESKQPKLISLMFPKMRW